MATNIHQLQMSQQEHDLHNHLDILSLHKIDRLKHYGLHYAKYVGRLARGANERKPLSLTLTDILLVSLSAANALNQRLPEYTDMDLGSADVGLEQLADVAGRFADACEKIDHLESFREIALDANLGIVKWVINRSIIESFDLESGIVERRKELSKRQVYNN